MYLCFRYSAEILSQDDIAVFSTPNTSLEIQSSQVNKQHLFKHDLLVDDKIIVQFRTDILNKKIIAFKI